MIFQHHPMLNSFSKRANADSDYQRFNYDILEGILNAFQQGTAYAHDSTTGKAPNGATSALFACTLSADFTAQGAGQIIAIWNGHIHRDLYTTTTFETLAAVTLTPNFTNKFSTADADFLSGQRFNSSGGISADSAYWVSGYIPITQGQTLRVKYGSVDAAPVWSSRPTIPPKPAAAIPSIPVPRPMASRWIQTMQASLIQQNYPELHMYAFPAEAAEMALLPR